MPFVNIKVAGPPLAPQQVRRLQSEAVRLMADVMRKRPELAAVLVETAPPLAWSVGADAASVVAHMDVKVTAGTNTVDEKARFVAEATALLRDVIGADLNPVSYVVVHELPADAWGYGGRTQAHRVASTKAA